LALDHKRDALEGQIGAMRAEFSAEEAIIARIFSKDKLREASLALDQAEMGRSRKGDAVTINGSRVRRNVTGGGQS
jgi:exosome complex RNA-binding protein Rrp4